MHHIFREPDSPQSLGCRDFLGARRIHLVMQVHIVIKTGRRKGYGVVTEVHSSA